MAGIFKRKNMAKATIIDYADPSVGLMQRDYSVDLPFEFDEIEADEREFFRAKLTELYGEFAEGKIIIHFEDELIKMEAEHMEAYCEGLLSKFKKSPNYDLEREFGRLLIKPIESLTKEERIRYHELDVILNQTVHADETKQIQDKKSYWQENKSDFMSWEEFDRDYKYFCNQCKEWCEDVCICHAR